MSEHFKHTFTTMKKTTENTTNTNATTKATLNDVSVVLDKLTIKKEYQVLRVFDNEEFNDNVKERKSYACIKDESKRAIVKLWGHTQFVTVECSKTLRKKVDVSKSMYTSKTLDKNNNYVCDNVKDAISLANDFIKQVDALNKSTTVNTKKAVKEA